MIKKISRESIEQVKADLEALLAKDAVQKSAQKNSYYRYVNISIQRVGDACWAEYDSSTKTLKPITEPFFEGYFHRIINTGTTPCDGEKYALYLKSTDGLVYCFHYLVHTQFKPNRLGKYHQQLTRLKPGQLVMLTTSPIHTNGIKCEVLVDGEVLEPDKA